MSKWFNQKEKRDKRAALGKRQKRKGRNLGGAKVKR